MSDYGGGQPPSWGQPQQPDNGGSGAPQGWAPPGQPTPGPPDQGQPNQGQPNQGQPNQGQPNQGQPSWTGGPAPTFPGQTPYGGQPAYTGQPYPGQPPDGGQPYPGQGGYTPYPGGWQGSTTRTSPLAIGALCTSLAGFVTIGFTGIIGFILGIVARKQIRRSGGQLTGDGMALAGIIVGGLMFLGFIAFIVVIIVAANDTNNYDYNNYDYNSLAHLGRMVGRFR